MIKDKGLQSAMSRMLKTLDQKVNPSHAAVIVIDMQNDWCESGGFMDREGLDRTRYLQIIPKIKRLLERAREIEVPIIYTRQITSSPYNWYLSDVSLEIYYRKRAKTVIEYPMCEKGSTLSEVYSALAPLPGDAVVEKYRYSAFVNTEFETILRSKGIRTLIVTGIGTPVCVSSTIRDGFMLDYYIVALSDCTNSMRPEQHEAELTLINEWFGEVVTSEDVLKCWSKR